MAGKTGDLDSALRSMERKLCCWLVWSCAATWISLAISLVPREDYYSEEAGPHYSENPLPQYCQALILVLCCGTLFIGIVMQINVRSGFKSSEVKQLTKGVDDSEKPYQIQGVTMTLPLIAIVIACGCVGAVGPGAYAATRPCTKCEGEYWLLAAACFFCVGLLALGFIVAMQNCRQWPNLVNYEVSCFNFVLVIDCLLMLEGILDAYNVGVAFHITDWEWKLYHASWESSQFGSFREDLHIVLLGFLCVHMLGQIFYFFIIPRCLCRYCGYYYYFLTVNLEQSDHQDILHLAGIQTCWAAWPCITDILDNANDGHVSAKDVTRIMVVGAVDAAQTWLLVTLISLKFHGELWLQDTLSIVSFLLHLLKIGKASWGATKIVTKLKAVPACAVSVLTLTAISVGLLSVIRFCATFVCESHIFIISTMTCLDVGHV